MPTGTRRGTLNPLPTVQEARMSSESPSLNQNDSDSEEEFILDPYQGDINPGNAAGSVLFNKATEGVESAKRVDVSLDNEKKVRTHCEDLCSKFGWGKLIHLVPDKDGKPRSMLREHQ